MDGDTIWDEIVDEMAQQICEEIDAILIEELIETAKELQRKDYDRAMEILGE